MDRPSCLCASALKLLRRSNSRAVSCTTAEVRAAALALALALALAFAFAFALDPSLLPPRDLR
jgi:hypothetical protein